MLGFLSFTRLHDFILGTGVELEAFLQHQYEMSKDTLKGMEVAPEPNWKEKLATLDQQVGWDEVHSSDWSDPCDEDDQQVSKENRPPPREDDDQSHSDASQSTGNVNDTAVQDLPDVFDDEEDENWDSEEDEDDYESDEEDIAPRHTLAGYLYHRFGPRLRWEDRCGCCEFLVDRREERRKRDRAYFAEAGVSCERCRCVLLPCRQADLPGTENVDKPVLMVTTPEGDQLYPHDLEEYPDMPAPSRGRRPLPIPKPKEYAVPYEEEDSPDV